MPVMIVVAATDVPVTVPCAATISPTLSSESEIVAGSGSCILIGADDVAGGCAGGVTFSTLAALASTLYVEVVVALGRDFDSTVIVVPLMAVMVP